jgi:hypothetical protein
MRDFDTDLFLTALSQAKYVRFGTGSGDLSPSWLTNQLSNGKFQIFFFDINGKETEAGLINYIKWDGENRFKINWDSDRNGLGVCGTFYVYSLTPWIYQ